MRCAQINRQTRETTISLELALDGSGVCDIQTDAGFLRHMLELFAHHGGFDLKLNCIGDSEVDFHHTTEDIGICLGKAFDQALGDRAGITRYGSFLLPMDEALAMVAADISGRGLLVWAVDMPPQKVGDFDTELAEEFFQAFVRSANITLHVRLLSGRNSHHIIEAVFKGVARALRQAVSIAPGSDGRIPSSKGLI